MSAQVVTFSVALVNYNYGRYLEAALDSALSQSHAPNEIVVVDDGSTDESREILRRFDSSIRVILQDNAGQTRATNRALAACRSECVALLDADDLMDPHRLARLAEVYSGHPDVDWVFNNLQYFDSTSGDRREVVNPEATTRKVDFRGPARLGDLSFAPLRVPTSGLSWRRAFVERFLPTPPNLLLMDNYLKFCSYTMSPGYEIGDVLTYQGLHDANIYTGSTGTRRRRGRASSAIMTVGGYRRLDPELQRLADRLLADALVLGAGGFALDADDRALLRRELRTIDRAQAARVARFALHSAAVFARDTLRERSR